MDSAELRLAALRSRLTAARTANARAAEAEATAAATAAAVAAGAPPPPAPNAGVPRPPPTTPTTPTRMWGTMTMTTAAAAAAVAGHRLALSHDRRVDAAVRAGGGRAALVAHGAATATAAVGVPYGTAPPPPPEAVARMVGELAARRAAKKPHSRPRPSRAEATDETAINESNRVFNARVERAFGRDTRELKDALERGSAL
ncbi:hypothetical protein BU14_0075s0059 [Porphyra umbilicalis]|uniref:Pre-mRNA-splicing factor SYF2 n=1 Tax=Porphyra umbilicalis TaxID=2786 RepID=A0A1X6PFE7_PORUM|nr:hypothetical protein BU14_0075s0059 [Porphyra umbilicalis]|eukprot:OSX79569.1 hypothetical protein BU14_0075s0059 [Porphyra umbilicalis]